jgi:cytochrome c-type biogenesis protein CcmH/NrfG
MHFIQKLIKRPAFWVICLPILVYANSLVNGFTFDDHAIVEDNPAVTQWDLARIFKSSYWPTRPEAGLYRPLTTLSFAIQNKIHGLDPFGYHLVNVLLHTANGYLVYRLAATLFPVWFGAIPALVFALHPVQTEAVNGIVGRAELLSAFWVLLAWLMYIRSGVGTGGLLNRHYLISVGMAFMAMLSKENAACLVGLLVVYDFVWTHRGCWPGGLGGWVKTGLPRYLPFVALVFVMLFLRTQVVGSLFLPVQPAVFENPLPHLDRLSRWLTTLAAIGGYIRLLIFPLLLSPDYSYGEIPVIATFADPLAWGPLFVILVVVGLVVVWFSGRYFHTGILGLLVFVVAFAPVSNILVIIGTILGERLLYLPMVGFAIFCGAIADRLTVGDKRHIVFIALVLLFGFYGLRTGLRNRDWQNDVTLFEKAVRDNNLSAKVYYNLGVGYRKQGRFSEAVTAFERVADLKPEDANSWKYLGIVYAEQGRYEKAAMAYHRAVGIEPTNAELWKRLGQVGENAENWAQAEQAYVRAVEIQEGDRDARYGLARVYEIQGKIALAVKQCEILLANYDFDHKAATLMLAKLYWDIGHQGDALALMQTAQIRWPDDPDVHAFLKTHVIP